MKLFTTLLCVSLFLIHSSFAQTEPIPASTDKSSSLEIGLHAGHFFSNGNVDFQPSFAAGLHLRKSLDYVFSLRGDAMFGRMEGEDAGNIRSHRSDWWSVSLQGLASLNNMKWSPKERKINIYVLGGVGVSSFEAAFVENNIEAKTDNEVQLSLEGGLGLSFKINDKFNVGIEHKAIFLTGGKADFVDGFNTVDVDNRRTFRDVPNYTSVRLNFNIGKSSEKTQPLYWLNPIEAVANDVQMLKDTRVTLRDDDGDGVINQLDEEEDTPEETLVNVKGVAIDTDNDGVPDYQDKEPFSPIGFEYDEEGVAQQPDIMGEVEKLLAQRLAEFEPKSIEPTKPAMGAGYLPAIYFRQGSTTISNADYGVLANVAQVMKANTALKFVVTGHTSKNGSEPINQRLSYQRAKNVVDFLEQSGVNRSQLILQYKSSKEPLAADLPSVNRRVGFKMASGEGEMVAPAGQN